MVITSAAMGKFLNQLLPAGRISRLEIDEVVTSAAMGKFLSQLAVEYSE